MNAKLIAYSEIVEVMTKHAGVLNSDDILARLNSVLTKLKLSERFGILLEDDKTGSHGVPDMPVPMSVRYMDGEEYSIYDSDDGRQPNGEWLLVVSLPSGPYILSDCHYAKQTFDKFFEELKSYGAKYADSHNYCLYFDETASRAVCEAINGMFAKYRQLATVESNNKRVGDLQARINQLQEELAKLN